MALVCHCIWVFSEIGYMNLHIKHISNCCSIRLYLCEDKHELIVISLTLIQYDMAYSLLPPFLINTGRNLVPIVSFQQWEKLGSHLFTRFSSQHMTSELLFCCCSVANLCLILGNSMDSSPLGSSVFGIFQARVLEWVAIYFSRGSSQSRDRTRVSCLTGKFFTSEPLGKSF